MRWIVPVHDTMPNCYAAEAFSFGKLKSFCSAFLHCIIAHEPTLQPRARGNLQAATIAPCHRLLRDLMFSPEARLNGSIHILTCAAQPSCPGRAAAARAHGRRRHKRLKDDVRADHVLLP